MKSVRKSAVVDKLNKVMSIGSSAQRSRTIQDECEELLKYKNIHYFQGGAVNIPRKKPKNMTNDLFLLLYNRYFN